MKTPIENMEKAHFMNDNDTSSKGTLNRRAFLRMSVFTITALGMSVLHLAPKALAGEPTGSGPKPYDREKYWWGYVVDTTKCLGCGSCVRACKAENNVADEYFRTWVERYEISENNSVRVDSPKGAFDAFAKDRTEEDKVIKGFFVPKLCNHCRTSCCTQVCPVGATFTSPDGVVLVDRKHCIGCGYCVQACPYGSRFVDHTHGYADKCTLCYHRITKGLETACVQACPVEARIAGNLLDPKSRIRQILKEGRYKLIKAELGTNPKCYYLGLDQEVS